MTKASQPIPQGVSTITAQLIVKGGAQAIEFYKRAFGATELSRMAGPEGLIMHASMKLGDSVFFLSDEMPGEGCNKSPAALGGTSAVLTLFVPDCDKVYKQAVSAGAKASLPLEDQFWGDRYGQVTDPFGQVWAIATHKEDLTPAEMEERGRKFMASMSPR